MSCFSKKKKKLFIDFWPTAWLTYISMGINYNGWVGTISTAVNIALFKMSKIDLVLPHVNL